MSHLLERFKRHPCWSELEKVAGTLSSSGFKAYLVGGCVRDGLIDRPINDFDLTTDARPEEVEKLFDHTLDVGKSFGTIIVMSGDEQFEVTTFRKDGEYGDGRHPDSVEFSNAEMDAQRRDFTMNALFYDLVSDSVIDYVNGVADINEKRIRAVGDPARRFDEDKLRMLRALRFSAQLGWEIETETKRAIVAKIDELRSVSKERVQVELIKTLTSWHPVEGLESLLKTGAVKSITDRKEWDSTLSRFKLFKNKIPFSDSLAMCLFVFDMNDEEAEKLLISLKFSKKFMAEVLELKKWGALDEDLTLSESRSLLAQSYREDLFSLVEVLWSPERVKMLNSVFAKYGDKLPEPLISGKDLTDMGFQPGPEMGKILDRIRKLQLDDKIGSKGEAMSKLRELKR